MSWFRFVTVGSIAVCAANASASPTVIQPTEDASKDVLIYQFLFNTNFDAGPFAGILGAGNTGPGGHDFRTLIQFDLPAGISIGAGEVATLNLWVGSTSAVQFGNDPTVATPVTHDVSPITGAWSETTVTWNSQPAAGASVASTTINGINRWVSYDITALAQSWIDNASSNNGMMITQRDVVGGGLTAAVYNSSSAANRPYFEIRAVPEPTLGLALALPALLMRRRRA